MAVAEQNPQDEEDIASELSAEGHEEDGDALDTLHLQLYHAHLPKLADAGFLDWDRDTGIRVHTATRIVFGKTDSVETLRN